MEWFLGMLYGEVKYTFNAIRANGIFMPRLVRLKTLELWKHPIRKMFEMKTNFRSSQNFSG